jgi:hypothetical protein
VSATKGISRKQAELNAYFLERLTALRAVFARRFKAELVRFPNMGHPCATCAFRTSTDDWVGFDQTFMHLVAALSTGSPFYCHHEFRLDKRGQYKLPMRRAANGEHVIDYHRMHLCAGWTALAALPADELAAVVPRELQELCIEITRAHVRAVAAPAGAGSDGAEVGDG